MENIKNYSESAEQEKVIVDFILKIAEDSSGEDAEVAEAIIEQLRQIHNSPNLPDILDLLDPERFHSETKLLSGRAKIILKTALDKYVNS